MSARAYNSTLSLLVEPSDGFCGHVFLSCSVVTADVFHEPCARSTIVSWTIPESWLGPLIFSEKKKENCKSEFVCEKKIAPVYKHAIEPSINDTDSNITFMRSLV